MSELKGEVEYVIKTGRGIVEKRQVDFPDRLSKQLDALKQQYNVIGAQVRVGCVGNNCFFKQNKALV